MRHTVYDTTLWRIARLRALRRDGRRCSVARLLGGTCAGTLHVHHLHPLTNGGEPYALDNLVTACAAHHPMLEALRRAVIEKLAGVVPEPPRCRHEHRTADAREQCERRMARRRARLAA